MLSISMILALSASAGPVASAPVLDPALSASPGYVLEADHVHTGAGSILEPGMVWVRDGRIAAVGTDVKATEDTPRVKLKGHLSAGMIALGETSLLGYEAVDGTRFVMPEAEGRLGFDPKTPGLQRLAQEGITTVVLTPPSHSLAAGKGVIAKTGTGRIVARAESMHMAFDSDMFEERSDPSTGTDFGGQFSVFFGASGAVTPNGYRSSYPGASALLEEHMAKGDGAFGDLSAGKLRGWLRSGNRAETARALSFAKRHKIQGTLEAGARVGDLAPQVKASGLGVALAPFTERSAHFYAQSAIALAEQSVPFGFCINAKSRHASALRVSAAVCRRAGLSEQAAWAALTSGAANATGIQDAVGELAPGRDADLVLWTGAPTELTSQVLRVWVDGQDVEGMQAKQGAKQ
ncbi:MAG: amidohydrolase family protein [Planctomycetes bacterium]|nr:amidohydrolase family protein [Planctomycetota bacterium]